LGKQAVAVETRHFPGVGQRAERLGGHGYRAVAGAGKRGFLRTMPARKAAGIVHGSTAVFSGNGLFRPLVAPGRLRVFRSWRRQPTDADPDGQGQTKHGNMLDAEGCRIVVIASGHCENTYGA
jgi:hypothetical protein